MNLPEQLHRLGELALLRQSEHFRYGRTVKFVVAGAHELDRHQRCERDAVPFERRCHDHALAERLICFDESTDGWHAAFRLYRDDVGYVVNQFPQQINLHSGWMNPLETP